MVIGSPVQDIKYNIKMFAKKINKKYISYKEMIPEFDKFIILADAYSPCSLEISEYRDISNLIDDINILDPKIKNVTIAVLWSDSYLNKQISEFCF